MDRMNYPTGREEHLAAVTGPTGKPPTVLVLGATGYIGGRLTPRLLKAGYRVRVLARSPARVRAFPWGEECDVVKGDVLDPVSVRAAMDSVSMIYYLVHSLASGRDFEQTDLCAAHVVAHAAARAGVGRIIYLGGLHPERTRLSSHLRSRRDVGQVFLDCTVPALVLQAGVIIGSGSASFEMIRHLTEVLPYMPAPKWVRNRIQPIAVRDVMHYLLGAARVPKEIDQAVDIGGPDVLTYAQMMNGYAEAAGLPRRFIVALPVLTPGLASHWVGLVTPVPRSIARPLVASLENECIMHSTEINGIIPPPPQGLTPYLESIRLALGRVQKDLVETSWQDVAVLGAPSAPLPSDPDWAGRTVYVDQRRMNTTATVEQLWSVISGVGGLNGWYSSPFLWAVRGWMDRLVGGVGLRRGRRSRTTLMVGDAIDFWRVEEVERSALGSRLRLRAEMKLPGTAWLELSASLQQGHTRYDQRAIFFPHGLSGRLYWFAVLPFHGLIFSGMVARITGTAEGRSKRSLPWKRKTARTGSATAGDQ